MNQASISANHHVSLACICYSLPLIRILPQINEIIYLLKKILLKVM